MHKIEFNEERHEYKVGGIIRPSVTGILKHFGLSDYSFVPERLREKAKARGRHVHKACALFDRGRLEPGSVAEQYRPYLRGWVAFKRDTGIIFKDIEKPHYNGTGNYCGTPDRTGIMHKRRVLVEIKTTRVFPAVAYQLWAYYNFYSCHQDLYVVALLPNGKYWLSEPYTDRSCYWDWIAMTRVYHLQEELGLVA